MLISPSSRRHANESTRLDTSIFRLAIRAIASFLVATCVLSLLYMAGLVPDLSGTDKEIISGGQLATIFFGWVVFSPLAETAVIAAVHEVASNVVKPRNAALIAAITMAALHGLIWWAWALIVVVPFLIFVIPFVQKQDSFKEAFFSCAATHAFHNLYAFLCFLVFYRMA